MSDATRVQALRRLGAGSPLVELALDSGERLRLHERRLAGGLRPGALLGGERLCELRRAQRLDRAEQRALALLARRPRSRSQLDASLARQGLAGDERRELVGRLTDLGLLDDEALAERLAETSARRGEGRLLLSERLGRLGLAQPEASPAAAGDGDDERRRAGEVLRRRFGEPPYGLELARRAQSLLARRGFDQETVATLLEREFLAAER